MGWSEREEGLGWERGINEYWVIFKNLHYITNLSGGGQSIFFTYSLNSYKKNHLWPSLPWQNGYAEMVHWQQHTKPTICSRFTRSKLKPAKRVCLSIRASVCPSECQAILFLGHCRVQNRVSNCRQNCGTIFKYDYSNPLDFNRFV